jgi:hypothetical protein
VSASNPLSNPHYLENMKPEGEHYLGEDGEKTLLGGLHTDHIFNILRAAAEFRVGLHPAKIVKLFRVLDARGVCPDYLAWRMGFMPVVIRSTGNLAYTMRRRFEMTCKTYINYHPNDTERIKFPCCHALQVLSVTYESALIRFLVVVDRVEVAADTPEAVEELFPGFTVTYKE